MSTAHCSPEGPWLLAESAFVASFDDEFSDRTLPVIHLEPGHFTVRRSTFPNGVVVIPFDHDPASSPASLPVAMATGKSLSGELDPEDPEDWAEGVAIVFV